MIESISAKECWILVDGLNRSYFKNSDEGRAQLLEDCTAMGLMDDYEQVLSAWGDEIPPPELGVLKADMLTELESSFDIRIHGSILTSQLYNMQFAPDDALKMQGALTLLEATGQTVGYLTQADDLTIYDVPIETMQAVMLEMMAAYAQCHARKQELRALINNAQTEDELAEIVISWPV